MGEQHLVVFVDRLLKPDQETVKKVHEGSSSGSYEMPLPAPEIIGPSTPSAEEKVVVVEDEEENGESDEETPLIKTAECRICQEEDSIKSMESPCGCRGSLKYAHRKCVQRWCDEKGDIICEICHKQYQPGYTAPPPRPQSEETTIDIGGGWQISGTNVDLHDPRLLAIAEAERQLLEAEYEYDESTNASGAAFCRSAALVLMALLLLRHALSAPDSTDGDNDASTFFTLFLIRVAGFLLPCYIMAWAISILQRRRERQDAAAAQFAFVLQSGQSRGMQFTIASAAPAAAIPQQQEDV